jgi:hypothetical protein
MLLLRMIRRFLVTAGEQDRGVQARGRVVGGALAVVGQQAPDHVVVHAEAAQEGVAGGDLHHLRRAEQGDQRRALLADAEAVERLLAVAADEALGQHQVGEVGFADFAEDLVCVHEVLRCLLFVPARSWPCNGANSEEPIRRRPSGHLGR